MERGACVCAQGACKEMLKPAHLPPRVAIFAELHALPPHQTVEADHHYVEAVRQARGLSGREEVVLKHCGRGGAMYARVCVPVCVCVWVDGWVQEVGSCGWRCG